MSKRRMTVNTIEEKKTNIMMTVYMICIIFFSDTVLFTTNANVFYKQIYIYGTFLLSLRFLFGYIFKVRKITINEIIALIACMSILVSALINATESFNIKAYIMQIIVLIFGICFSYYCSLENFAQAYLKMMRLIAIASIICFIFGNLIVQIPGLPEIVNEKGLYFKTLLVTNLPINSILLSRNWGPFREPGVYQVFLIFAIIFSLFVEKRHKVIDTIIFSIALITTLSGAGLVPLVLLIFAFIIDKNENQDKKIKRRLILIGIFAVIISIATDYTMLSSIISKTTGQTSGESLGIRVISMFACIKCFFMNPLFGVSYDIQSSVRLADVSQFYNVQFSGLTNTYLGYFSTYGIIVGLFYIVNTYKFTKKLSRNKFCIILIFIAIFLSTSNEDLMQNLLISVIIFLSKKGSYMSTKSQNKRIQLINNSKVSNNQFG